MDFKGYPSYKDSGVKWLGEVPEHWNVVKLKNVLKKNITDGPHETPIFIEEGIPFLSVDSIQNGELVFENCRYISEEAHKLYSKKAKVEKNDLLMGKAASIGKIALVKVDFEFSIWSPLALIKIKPTKASSKYMEYLLKSTESQVQIDNLSTYSTQKNISMADIPKIRFSIPCLKEQSAITSFLDSETSRIDNLIAKQEKLIEKLEEHRKSIISHAVTKGLDPNVPMKDSGVELLGKVPEHWKLLQTRHIFNFGKGLTITKEDLSDEGIPCINYGEIHSKYGFEFNPLDNPLKCVSHDFIESNKNCLLNEGDFIFADTSEDLEGSGNFSYLNQKSRVFAGYHTIIARPKSGLNHRYLAYMFDSQAYRSQVRTEMKGVKVYSVSQGVLKSRLAWLPPIEEQDQIVKLLDVKTSKIDTLIAKQRELIAKLKNYRTSIISHAVTGKIDVRDLVA